MFAYHFSFHCKGVTLQEWTCRFLRRKYKKTCTCLLLYLLTNSSKLSKEMVSFSSNSKGQQKNVSGTRLGELTFISWEWKGWAPCYQHFSSLYCWICCFYPDNWGQRQAWDCLTCWDTCRRGAPSCFPFRQGRTCGGWPCYGKHESVYYCRGCYWKLWYAVIYQRNGWCDWFWWACCNRETILVKVTP